RDAVWIVGVAGEDDDLHVRPKALDCLQALDAVRIQEAEIQEEGRWLVIEQSALDPGPIDRFDRGGAHRHRAAPALPQPCDPACQQDDGGRGAPSPWGAAE